MPALLTRMSTLPKRSSAAPTSDCADSGCGDVGLDRERLRPSASTSRRGLGGRGRVRAVAEADVGALRGEAQGDGTPDAARAARDDGGLARRGRSSRLLLARVARAPRARRRRAGRAGPTGRRAPPRGAAASGPRPPTRPARARWPPATTSRERAERAGSAVQVSATAPLVKPAPKATRTRRSPGCDATAADGLVERDGDRGGRRVAVAIDVDEHLLHREPEPLGDRLDDTDVRLMGDEEVDVVRRPAGLLDRRERGGRQRPRRVAVRLAALHADEVLAAPHRLAVGGLFEPPEGSQIM